LRVFNEDDAKRELTSVIENVNSEIFADCDDDTFLIQRENLAIADALVTLWENKTLSIAEDEINSFIKIAPSLFPILAIDLNGSPLMLAWGKPESIEQAIESGHGTYYSRSRNKKWVKGEESGHLQNLRSIVLSTSPFYIIYKTEQLGAACHTGYYSCFYRQMYKDKEPSFVFKNKVEDV